MVTVTNRKYLLDPKVTTPSAFLGWEGRLRRVFSSGGTAWRARSLPGGCQLLKQHGSVGTSHSDGSAGLPCPRPALRC